MASALKMSAYFGERDRVGQALLADQLMELLERRAVNGSVLLRGVEGFGLRHHLRTDRLLTLSEDLPVLCVAVDRPELIQDICVEAQRVSRRGLITLERARIVDGSPDPEIAALADADQLKLTIMIGRHERVDAKPAFIAVCDLLHDGGVAGATVLLGVDGTRWGRRRRARLLSGNAEVPLVITAVGPAQPIAAAMEGISALVSRPLMSLERVRICKRDGRLLAVPSGLGAEPAPVTRWQKLEIYSSESSHHEGIPVHRAIVRALRGSGGAGATSLRGIWGFHGEHRPHGDRFLQVRRHVGVVTIVVGSSEQISAAWPIVHAITADSGLVISENVPAMRAVAGSERHGELALNGEW